MQKTEKRMRICITLLILNLAFIWGNSLLPGEISSAFSHWVKDLLAKILPISAESGAAGHGLLRKLAHFTEFCCLGMCLMWLFSMLGKKIWLPLVCGILAACTDELIQCIVPDRGPGIRDVIIDSAGVLLGVCILCVGSHIVRKRKKQMEERPI